ncbi:MAG TPA: XkdF-like putative serine protease domain-containing protein, partial [Candidatus Paceibacterota bacterium]|nr:XkdF-like putative serine protease domain-containing protein [Candidatus Paceibacterota bacterium]
MDINLKSLLFELVFDPDKDGVTAISLVDSPAILTNFIKLGEEIPDIKIVMANEEKRIVLGPALIPNVKIFRSGRSLGLEQDAYVFFREDTIRALAEDYIMKAKNNNVTLQHKDKTYDVKMVESWIIEDPAKDKAAFYGFELPKGTWMTAFKILDDELWEDIKDGEMRGFSIEAALGLVPKGEISLSEEEPEDDRIVLEKELQPLFLQRLDEVGHKEDIMRHLGFVKVSEDGNLTKEGEAIALTFAVSAEPAEKSALDDGLYAIRYKYSGPLDEKNRDFCRDVMTKDLIYRKEDIDQMSFRGENPMSKQNYSIFRYKGSYNCRHRWVKQVYFAADWEKALDDLELYLEQN